jgi:hypothetical protein
LVDTPAGNAQGWNPDGVTTDFVIIEPAVGDIDTSFISINLNAGGDNVCSVDDMHLDTGFAMKCTTAPANEVELHYVVENLPSHRIS